jgi:tryptophan-rich sensory protein
MTTCPPLQICPVESRNQYSPTRVFTRPWHLLQWMKDPEEWINNIARLNNNNRRGGRAPFQPDALLFPSTWPPLHVLSCVGMIRAIRMSLSLDDSLRSSSSIMRNACVQLALYEEWHRVFLQEKRVALGVVVQVVSFLALLNLVYVISMVDGVAGVLLTPALLASLVSGWMNIVLYNERALVQKKPNGKRTRSERNSMSRSVVVVAGS